MSDLVEMLQAASRDERLADGMLYRKAADEIERLREAESILKELLATVKQTPNKSFADLMSDEWINILRQTERFLDNG